MISYQSFAGRTYSRALAKLKGADLVPITTKWVLEQRVASRGTDRESEFWHNWFDTADGIVRGTDCSVKIRVQSPALFNVTEDTPTKRYGICNSPQAYEAINAPKISADTVEKDFNRYLALGEAEHHEGWLQLAQGDTTLLREYDHALRTLREKQGYDPDNAMGLVADLPARDAAIEAPVILWHIGGDIKFSGRGGASGGHLDIETRLSGVPPQFLKNSY